MDKSTIIVGKGPPQKSKLGHNSFLFKKGNIYFGYGPPQRPLPRDDKQTSGANCDLSEKGVCEKKSKVNLAKKIRLIGKLVNFTSSNNDQNRQFVANWGYICSDNESEEGFARLNSRSNSETFSGSNSCYKLIMTRNHKYNDIVTSHAYRTQALASIDKDIDVYRKSYNYEFGHAYDDVDNGIKFPFKNEFQEGFMTNYNARTPPCLWNEYIRFGNSGDI